MVLTLKNAFIWAKIKLRVNNNRVWYLVSVMAFVPLLIFNSFMPLYWLNSRSFNGSIYYMTVFIFGVLILGAISAVIIILSKKIIEKVYKKIFYGILIVYSCFAVCMRTSFYRKEQHLKQFGELTTAQVTKYENYKGQIRVHFCYFVSQNLYKGILEYPNDQINLENKTLKIIVSKKDPRIYEQ